MVSVAEATSLIQAHLIQMQKEKVGIIESTGRILAESIYADRDFPPFDRATMDGIAITSSAFAAGKKIFKIAGIQAAGKPQMELTDSGSCLEVMTGAMLPKGTDTVIPYENIRIENGHATIQVESIAVGESIHVKGMDASINSLLLSPGIRISPAEVALLASIGKSEVDVVRYPKTAVISTGDELVAVDKIPLTHQIRQSNVYALQAALLEMGCGSQLFSIIDEKEKIKDALTQIMKDHELIILSGGVSKGKYDFIPEVLESLGIKKHLHQVSQRPGKPLWFGTSKTHTVFALPGNPVSTYMCFYRYIKPWLLGSAGASSGFATATLGSDYTFMPNLTYFLQVKIKNENGMNIAFPDTGGGSGDFANLKHVDGFLELPLERKEFKKGESFPFIQFRA